MKRERIKIYVCKSLNGARKLFELFKSMNLDYLDEESFFHICECAEKDIYFTVRFNTWAVGEKETNEFFEVTETEVFE